MTHEDKELKFNILANKFLRDSHEFNEEEYSQALFQIAHIGFCRFNSTKELLSDLGTRLKHFAEDEPQFSQTTEEIKEKLIVAGILEKTEEV